MQQMLKSAYRNFLIRKALPNTSAFNGLQIVPKK